MDIKICENKAEWDADVLKCLHTPFHQLWKWGEFEKSRKEAVYRICKRDASGKIVSAAQIIVHKLPFGLSYAWAPRPPASGVNFKNSVLKFLLARHKIIFLTWDTGGWRLPQESVIINLSKRDEDILAGMRDKWRYNISLAKRKGIAVDIKENPEEKDIKTFCKLLGATSQRGDFNAVPPKHVEQIFGFFKYEGVGNESVGAHGRNSIRLWLAHARHTGRVLASNILLGAGDTLTYLHGASDYDARAFMAPHLLQWSSIQFARRQGYKFYDFWGVATDKSNPKRKKWEGITRFKLGFGGDVVKFNAVDVIAFRKTLYKAYKFFKPS